MSEICTPERESALKIALDPVLFSVLQTFFMLNALNGAASAVFTLFAYTPVKDGGLSRNVCYVHVSVVLSLSLKDIIM